MVALLRGKGREGSAVVRTPESTGWPGMEPLMAGDTLVWVGHARGHVRAWSMDGWLQHESSNQVLQPPSPPFPGPPRRSSLMGPHHRWLSCRFIPLC